MHTIALPYRQTFLAENHCKLQVKFSNITDFHLRVENKPFCGMVAEKKNEANAKKCGSSNGYLRQLQKQVNTLRPHIKMPKFTAVM